MLQITVEFPLQGSLEVITHLDGSLEFQRLVLNRVNRNSDPEHPLPFLYCPTAQNVMSKPQTRARSAVRPPVFPLPPHFPSPRPGPLLQPPTHTLVAHFFTPSKKFQMTFHRGRHWDCISFRETIPGKPGPLGWPSRVGQLGRGCGCPLSAPRSGLGVLAGRERRPGLGERGPRSCSGARGSAWPIRRAAWARGCRGAFETSAGILRDGGCFSQLCLRPGEMRGLWGKSERLWWKIAVPTPPKKIRGKKPPNQPQIRQHPRILHLAPWGEFELLLSSDWRNFWGIKLTSKISN